jgi:flagellum-specific ATP synthase
MTNTLEQRVKEISTYTITGRVVETVGMTAAVADFPAPVGALVRIERDSGLHSEGEVVGFRDGAAIVYLYTPSTGVRRGSRARLVRTSRMLRAGEGLLGRVFDDQGRTIDGRPQPMLADRVRPDRQPPSPLDRPRIRAPLATGVHVIDAMLTCGRGQRLGIFSGSGVGKSTLLGMMARHTDADVVVIGLIGERGREVNDFIERDLGPTGLGRSVVVVATSNEPALARVQAAFTATAIAEYFRDLGRHVLLLLDSATRIATAQREIGLAAGEPPTTRGYPPSTFALLPRLVERAGRDQVGSITAFYSVLVEGDDPNEPVADTMRGLLDGHVWLSRKLAAKAHYPAVDVLPSISRLMNDVAEPQHVEAAATIRRLLAVYDQHEDLLSLGAYRPGSNPELDVAAGMREAIAALFRQQVDRALPLDRVRAELVDLAAACQTRLRAPAAAA